MKKKHNKSENGLSLIECLVSLSLFLAVFLSSLEFFAIIRSHFLKLKEDHETSEAAYSALDKMRIDVLEAGGGLFIPSHLGALDCIKTSGQSLTVYSQEKSLSLLTDLTSGQTRIVVGKTGKIRKGREICAFDSQKSEVKLVSSVDKQSMVISSPLRFSYDKEKAHLVLLKKISFFLDDKKHILRRKVNTSPSQPLAEDVTFFDFDYDRASRLIRIRIGLNARKEKEYEISVFPKNAALALR